MTIIEEIRGQINDISHKKKKLISECYPISDELITQLNGLLGEKVAELTSTDEKWDEDTTFRHDGCSFIDGYFRIPIKISILNDFKIRLYIYFSFTNILEFNLMINDTSVILGTYTKLEVSRICEEIIKYLKNNITFEEFFRTFTPPNIIGFNS